MTKCLIHHPAVSLMIAALLSCAATAETAPKLALDQPAPEVSAATADNKPVSLSSLRTDNPDKILVLQFASTTDPVFRAHVAAVEKLAAKESEKATFVLLYQKEAHAADSTNALNLNATDGFNIAEPATLTERQKLAAQTVGRLGIKHQTLIVDAWNNASSLRYGSYPNMTFIIDAKGKLQAGYPFMDPPKVQAAIDLLADGKQLSPELKGPTQKNGPAPFDFSSAAMDMTGGRGPASIAAILDRVTLTDTQRQTLLPALADLLADVQTFRQTRQAVPNLAPARAGRAAAPPTAPAAAQAANAEAKTPQDLEDAQAALKASAARAQSIIKQTLPAKDAAALLDALNNMAPAQRLFAN